MGIDPQRGLRVLKVLKVPTLSETRDEQMI